MDRPTRRTYREWVELWIEHNNEHMESLDAYLDAFEKFIAGRTVAKEVDILGKSKYDYGYGKAMNVLRNHYKDNLTRYTST